MIANARELPLTVELPVTELDELDLGIIMQESNLTLTSTLAPTLTQG